MVSRMTIDHSIEFLPQFDRMQKIVEAALPKLPELHRTLMSLRFGIGCDVHNLQEAGDKVQLSRIEVRRIEVKLMQELLAADSAGR